MSWLDRFRGAQGTPNTRPLGESGRQQASGILIEDDHNPELTGITGIRELDRMHRADADARGAVRMISNPILSSTWSVEPYGGDEADDAALEVAEFVEWAIFEHLGWRTHLWTALDVVLPLGHAPFEQVWELVDHDGTQRWACCLDLRLPRSVWRFWQDDAGRLEAIEQQTRGMGMVRIPAEQLVYYRLSPRGDNWRGESLLRSAYKHFHYKEKLELIAAIAEEKFAVGTPIAYPPQSASDEAREALADILAGLRAHESGYVVSPWPHAQFADPGTGAVIEILQPSSEHDMVPILNYHSGKIAASVLQEFMRLGHANVGAKATAETQANPFMEFCEAISGTVIEDTINTQLIPRLVALNFPNAEGCPRLRASLIDQTTIAELSDAVSKLVTAKAITVDGPLEDWLRDYMGMPTIDPQVREGAEAAADAAQQPEQPAPAADPSAPVLEPEQTGGDHSGKPSTLTLKRQSRPLMWWEETMQLDRVEAAIDGARERFVAAAQPITHRLAASLAASPDGDPPSPGALSAALAGELHGLYWTGRDTVQQELQAQRPSVTRTWRLAGSDPVPEDLRLRAQAAAENVIGRMVAAVRRDVLARSATTQASMQVAAEAAARGALREEAQHNAAFALNAGRAAEADDNQDVIEGARYTSILDGNRCSACAAADDDVLRPMDDPVRLERIPPNPECDGGDKCRCLEFFQLADESAPSA